MLILLSAIAAAMPARADFCFLTQNALRLGQGAEAYRAGKRDGFRRVFAAYDVVALQEVMDPDEPGRLAPEGFSVVVSTAKGGGGYREHYAMLMRGAAARLLDVAEFPDAEGAFVRPPFAVAIEDKDGDRFWLVGIHVVFGRGGLEPRRREVGAMTRVLDYYAARSLPDGSTIGRVVVAGDWNLAAADPAFAQVAAGLPGLRAAPDLKTSLNSTGRYVSAYDHFLWNGRNLAVDFAPDPRETGGLDTAVWRAVLSDHVGVAGYVMNLPGERRSPDVRCPPLPRDQELSASTTPAR